ncbi:hypothetical protein EDM80_06145 [bacterium]|nr:MAG: hypothetical protein EDM80_06145 [bacterium]RIK63752.1 MAG: hypothetical protein DCC64_06455 [Planctomycetota bacterium]
MMEAYAVHEGGHRLVHLKDKFDPEIKDTSWIGALAGDREEWIVVCGDNKILRKRDEVAAMVTSGLSYFFLRGGWWDQTFHQIAVKFLKVWPAIVSAAADSRESAIWEVPVSSDKLLSLGQTAHYRR